MPTERIRNSLSQLKIELDAADKLDGATNESLSTAVDNVEELIETRSSQSQPPSEASSETSPVTLSESLRREVVALESDHPRLFAAVNQLAEALANLGI